ncbi:MAG TPA: GDYXXLXY domain-containing protein [Planctomycetota bacterium]|nr:GDYXXLXY domain-containing protein [Planctomycetota bacterium]
MRRHVGIAAVLLAQTGLLVAIPLRTVRARLSGTEVTLETEPVDPFDPLSGYYATLAYLAERPTGPAGEFHENEPVWVTVERGEPAWKPFSVTRERPAPAADRVSLRGRWERGRGRIEGASRFYISEERREEVGSLLRQARQRALVDLRVGEDGTPGLLRLHVAGKTFGR